MKRPQGKVLPADPGDSWVNRCGWGASVQCELGNHKQCFTADGLPDRHGPYIGMGDPSGGWQMVRADTRVWLVDPVTKGRWAHQWRCPCTCHPVEDVREPVILTTQELRPGMVVEIAVDGHGSLMRWDPLAGTAPDAIRRATTAHPWARCSATVVRCRQLTYHLGVGVDASASRPGLGSGDFRARPGEPWRVSRTRGLLSLPPVEPQQLDLLDLLGAAA